MYFRMKMKREKFKKDVESKNYHKLLSKTVMKLNDGEYYLLSLLYLDSSRPEEKKISGFYIDARHATHKVITHSTKITQKGALISIKEFMMTGVLSNGV